MRLIKGLSRLMSVLLITCIVIAGGVAIYFLIALAINLMMYLGSMEKWMIAGIFVVSTAMIMLFHFLRK